MTRIPRRDGRRLTVATRRGTRRAGAVVTALALLGVVLPFGVTPAGAAPRDASSPTSAPVPRQAATFGIGPSDGKRVDGRSALNFLASPGAVVTDDVAVVNLARRSTTLRIYAADAVAGADGSIGYQPRAVAPRDAARWITPRLPGRSGVVTLRPRQTLVVPLKVAVPTSAEPGDHIAGIIASLTSKVRGKNGQLIDFEQRVAVRVSFRISGELRPQLTVQNLDASYHDSVNPFGAGSATVTYTVRNTGNVTLGARQRVTVSGLFGEDAARSVAALPQLLPGTSVQMSVDVPDVVPQVRLTGRVVLYPLTVKGSSNPGLQSSYVATTGFWGVPWALLVVVVLLVALAVAARALRRHPRFSDNARHRTRPALS